MLALRDLCCRPVLGVSIQGLEVQIENPRRPNPYKFCKPSTTSPGLLCTRVFHFSSSIPRHVTARLVNLGAVGVLALGCLFLRFCIIIINSRRMSCPTLKSYP